MNGPKVFLSARYSRKGELFRIRKLLQTYNFQVAARWLDTEWTETEREGQVYSSAAPPEYREQYSIWDKEDVLACDYFVAFTEEPRSNTRGGRHVEFGMAIASGKKLVVVGPRENIFHYLPEVNHLTEVVEYGVNILELLTYLERKK